MKRAWILVLCLSIGLNIGLLIVVLGDRGASLPSEESLARGNRKGPPHLREEFRSPGKMREELGRRMERLSRDLGLTEGQADSLIAIREKAFPQLVESHEMMAEIRDHLREAYLRGTEEEQIRSYVRELNQTRARIDSLIAEAMIAEAHVLTPEQRAGYVASLPWDHPGPPDGPTPSGHRHGRHQRR